MIQHRLNKERLQAFYLGVSWEYAIRNFLLGSTDRKLAGQRKLIVQYILPARSYFEKSSPPIPHLSLLSCVQT